MGIGFSPPAIVADGKTRLWIEVLSAAWTLGKPGTNVIAKRQIDRIPIAFN
jgi:hypothetical protein